MIKKLLLNSIMICISLVWLAPLWLMVIFATHSENTVYMENYPFVTGVGSFLIIFKFCNQNIIFYYP